MSDRAKQIRRWTITGGVLLALGLVTSVAVAWAASVWFLALTPMHQSYNLAWQTTHTTITIPTSASQDPDGALRWSHGFEQSFPAWSRFHIPPESAEQKAIEFAAGWPFSCVTYQTHAAGHVGFDYFGQHYEGELHGLLALQRFNPNLRDIQLLPRRPIVLNLTLDAIFWAFVWLLLLNGRRIWRLNLWLRRSPQQRCAWCGYILKKLESDRCPECGNVHTKAPTLLVAPTLRTLSVLLVILFLGTGVFVGRFVSGRQGEPIHHSALVGNLESLKVEISHGVDLNLPMKGVSYEGLTPLMLAGQSGHGEVFDHLLGLGAELDHVSARSGNVLTMAIRYERDDLVSKLLAAGAEVNTRTNDQMEPLIAAIDTANVELFATLIERGADVKWRGAGGMSPLEWLVITRLPIEIKTEMVLILLEAGASPNPPAGVRIGSPLSNVLSREELGIARILLEAGLVIDYDALGRAAWADDPEALNLLLGFGADLNMRDPQGRTLFFGYMYYSGKPRYWDRLLEGGVDLDAVDAKGQTALMAAVDVGQWDLVRFLLEHGADPTITAAGGLTVVDIAQQERAKEILREAIRTWNAEHEETGTDN